MEGLTTALLFGSAGGDSSAHVPAQNKGICKVAQEFQRSGWGALRSLFWAGMHVEKRQSRLSSEQAGRKVGSLQELCRDAERDFSPQGLLEASGERDQGNLLPFHEAGNVIQ